MLIVYLPTTSCLISKDHASSSSEPHLNAQMYSSYVRSTHKTEHDYTVTNFSPHKRTSIRSAAVGHVLRPTKPSEACRLACKRFLDKSEAFL